MTIPGETMTDEQRKSVAIEYLKAFDRGGVTSTGGSILDLFADDTQVYFPKWGLADGKEQIGKLFGKVGRTIRGCSILVIGQLLRGRARRQGRLGSTDSRPGQNFST